MKHLAKTAGIVGRIRTSYPRLLRILVPLDFSGKSRQALRYAVPLAQKFSARVHLVHVLASTGATDLASRQRQRRTALHRLAQMSEQLLPPRLRTENAVVTGQPAEAILALAAKNNIDLIVLTPKSRNGLARALIGSTAERIMRKATCPVLSVRRR